jgi:tetratricopeptide (TPR) repeat protein
MLDRVRLLQKKLSIGSSTRVTLKSGLEYVGVLTELSMNHISLKGDDGGEITIFIEDISVTKILESASTSEEMLLSLDDQFSSSEPSETKSLQTIQYSQIGDTVQSYRFQSPIAENEEPTLEDDISFRQQSAGEYSADYQSEVHIWLRDVEARFDSAIETTSRLKLIVQEFAGTWEKSDCDALSIWNRIYNQYTNAKKIQELDPKFGRVQRITSELLELTQLCPAALGPKRLLGYMYLLQENREKALLAFKDAAVLSQQAQDWCNVAAVALQQEELNVAEQAFESYFSQILPSQDENVWYRFLSLVRQSRTYSGLDKIFKNLERLSFPDEAHKLFTESVLYLLIKEHSKIELLPTREELLTKKNVTLIQKLLVLLPGYETVAADSEPPEEKRRQAKRVIEHVPQGFIVSYWRERGYGFIRDRDDKFYFFHRSALVSDGELVRLLEREGLGEEIPVQFEGQVATRGLKATKIRLFRTVEQMFDLAKSYAGSGEYNNAIATAKDVLRIDPDYPDVQDFIEQCQEQARRSGLPRGSNAYAMAKKATDDGRLDEAINFFRLAIRQNYRLESAIKDLAQLFARMGRHQEAIQVLQEHRHRIANQQSVDNLLTNIFMKDKQYQNALQLLEKKLADTQSSKKSEILIQISDCHMRLGNYSRAEQILRETIKSGNDSRNVQMSLALCLIQQREYEEAREILQNILERFPDNAKALELLNAADEAQRTGGEIDETIVNTTLSERSSEISPFTRFFLDKCKYEGVPPVRLQEGKVDHTDVQKLEELATKLGTRNPVERASYYLSAAKIITTVDDDWDEPIQLYKYLSRSFTSRGDAAIVDRKPLDVARELYCEALSIYDGYRRQRVFEQDAVNALVRLLYSVRGRHAIPMTPQIPSIDETLEEILKSSQQLRHIFDFLVYIMSRSDFARSHIFHRLYREPRFRQEASVYLRSGSDNPHSKEEDLKDFISQWEQRLRNFLKEEREVAIQISLIANAQFTIGWVEDSIQRIEEISNRLFLELDRQRLNQLKDILQLMLKLCQTNAFEDEEYLCQQIDLKCQELIKEIEDNPTKLSVERLSQVITALQVRTKDKLNQIYATSLPQITLKLPIDYYVPDNNQRLEIQIKIINRIGCSPAESLAVIVQEDNTFFSTIDKKIQLNSSLRGGDDRIIIIPIQLTKEALRSQAFSFSLLVSYSTRLGEKKETSIESFSIPLYRADQFEEIPNPYATWAEGGPVHDSEMFYGRTDLIHNLTEAIKESRSQSKSIIIYGQMRAGKSSILYHLKQKLEQEPSLLVLDIGNIGTLLDPHAKPPIFHQFLWSILRCLKDALEDQFERGWPALALEIKTDEDFYTHPAPSGYFRDVFNSFKRKAMRTPGWSAVRPIILIDEFSYLYNLILEDKLPADFMRIWKALLQENSFSVVLVGQDIMPKFKQAFPNEFGTTQDERVSYLRREDAEKLIDEPIRIGGKHGETRYREHAIQRIYDLTSGSPFYIQIICNRLVEYMNRKRAKLVTEADVEKIKFELIFGANSLEKDKFDNLINSGDSGQNAIPKEDILKVLTEIAIHCHPGPCDRDKINCETSVSVDSILEDLLRREVLERIQGRYYKIRVELFRDWLIAHQ